MASSIKNDWEEQLLALRGLTAMTGALHEAQVLQLRQWGALAFQNKTGTWEAHVDVDKRAVTYKLTTKRRSPPTELAPLIAALDRSLHWLLGDEWVLQVRENGKAVYTGDRQVVEPASKRAARVGKAT